jgi:hypothetical protein
MFVPSFGHFCFIPIFHILIVMEDISQPIEVDRSMCGHDSMISPSLEDESQTMGPLIDENPKNNAYGKRKRRKTSLVWNDFVIVEVGGVKKSQCKWCQKLFAISSSSSTSTLGRHLVACLKYVAANKKQKSIVLDPNAAGDISLSNYTFKIERSRELAAHMILCHDYPFNIMEHELFNKFCKSLNPLWKKVSRTTIRKDCFTTYNIEKKKLKTLLGGGQGQHHHGYMDKCTKSVIYGGDLPLCGLRLVSSKESVEFL